MSNLFIKLGTIPPFKILGILTYRLMQYDFDRRLGKKGKRPLVVNYKGSMARGDFVPGRSDLDVQIVYRSETNFIQLITTLEELQKSLLWRIIPIMGEIELIDEDTYQSLINNSFISLFHRPVLTEQNGLKYKLHPHQLAQVMESVFDYSFYGSIVYNSDPDNLEKMQRLSVKVLRPLGVSARLASFNEIRLNLEQLVSPFITMNDIENTPKQFSLNHALGPFMAWHPTATFKVIDEKMKPAENNFGSMGHPPIIAGKNLRAFLFKLFNLDRINQLSPEVRQVWNEMEKFVIGTQWRGHYFNSYGSKSWENLPFSYFLAAALHWSKLISDQEMGNDLKNKYSIETVLEGGFSQVQKIKIAHQVFSDVNSLNSSR